MCEGKRNDPDLISVLFFLFTIIAIIAVIYVMFRLDCFDDRELAYSFIGIIATFVVVGNFAQIVEMRNETKRKMVEMEENQEKKIKDLEDAVQIISDIIQKHDGQNKI